MYQVHQDAVKLPVFVESEEVRLGFGSLPALTASASVDEGGRIHVSLTNCDPALDRTAALELPGFSPKAVSGRIITSAGMGDHNTFDSPDAVAIREFGGAAVSGSKLAVTLPAKSVVTLELA
jgi:alpha-N-arabinofuranosidase